MSIKNKSRVGIILIPLLGGIVSIIGLYDPAMGADDDIIRAEDTVGSWEIIGPSDSLFDSEESGISNQDADSAFFGEFYAEKSAGDSLTFLYQGSILWNRCKDVKVVGDFAYCTFGPGLIILDISDPAHPVLASRLYLQATCEGLDIDGNYAYVTMGFCAGIGPMIIVDITDPFNPRMVSQVRPELGYTASNVQVVGDIAYLCAGDHGLRLIRLTDPAHPYQTGYYDNSAICNIYDIEVIDTIAYVIDYNCCDFRILDISYPPLIPCLASITILGNLTSVHIKDTLAFITNKNNENGNNVTIINISNPQHPVLLYTYYLPASTYPYDIEFSGDIGLVTGGLAAKVLIIDFSNPMNPILLGQIDHPQEGDCWNVNIVDSLAFMASGSTGLQVASFADPANPYLISSYCDQPGYVAYGVQEVKIEDDYAFISIKVKGIHSVSIADPTKPIHNNWYELYSITDICPKGDLAYVAAQSNGLRIIDITDPTTPVPYSYYLTPGSAYEVAVYGNTAYVPADTSGLQIFDISDPDKIERIGFYNDIYTGNAVGQGAKSIEVVGDFAYLGDWLGLQILDISNPAHPVALGRCDTPARVNNLVIRDTIAYLAAHTLVTANISDPMNPYIINALTGICADPYELILYGKYALVAHGDVCYTRSIMAVDISDPANLLLAGSYDTPGDDVRGIALDGRHLYAGDEHGFLSLYVNFPYVCGDVNNDDAINILDIVYLIDYKFKHGPAPWEPKSGDVTGDGQTNILDIVYLISYRFMDGPSPICR